MLRKKHSNHIKEVNKGTKVNDSLGKKDKNHKAATNIIPLISFGQSLYNFFQ